MDLFEKAVFCDERIDCKVRVIVERGSCEHV